MEQDWTCLKLNPLLVSKLMFSMQGGEAGDFLLNVYALVRAFCNANLTSPII